MNNKHTALRGLLWFICIYHVILGLCANLPPPQVQSIARTIWDIHLPNEPALYQVIKPFGTYVIIFGVAMGVAAWNPVKNRALVSIGVVLFAIRLVQRLFEHESVQQNLRVSTNRHWATIATVAAFALLLIFFRWKLYREMSAERVPETLT
jgi:hypothetical protein